MLNKYYIRNTRLPYLFELGHPLEEAPLFLFWLGKYKNRSLWTQAHLAFRLRTHNLVLVAKGT